MANNESAAGDYDPVAEVTREALSNLRAAYTWSMRSLHATDAERQLARMKLGLITLAEAKV